MLLWCVKDKIKAKRVGKCLYWSSIKAEKNVRYWHRVNFKDKGQIKFDKCEFREIWYDLYELY